MASRGSILRRSSASFAHAAAYGAEPTSDPLDASSGTDVESDSQASQSSASDESSGAGGEPVDFSYPSTDPPYHLVPNAADRDDTLVASPPTEAAALESQDGATPISKKYKYVHHTWKSGEFVMLRHVSENEANAINAILNHFNQAADHHGDLLYTDPVRLYHEICHLEMDEECKEHVLAACGFRLTHEPLKE